MTMCMVSISKRGGVGEWLLVTVLVAPPDSRSANQGDNHVQPQIGGSAGKHVSMTLPNCSIYGKSYLPM